MNELEKKLGYEFKNASLLDKALRHRSAQGTSNERLEFIGDSILGFVIATELFQKYPDFREGKLSRLRANLVKQETLAILAKEFDLGDFLYLGSGEKKSGGYRRASILADALEAIIGAIYLDTGIEICQKIVLKWYDKKIVDWASVADKDPKSELQEFLQSKQLPLPRYSVSKTTGKSHEQVFYINCSVEGIDHTTDGAGSNRRQAEQEAAKKFLEYLGV